MKPSATSTGIAFVILGVALIAWGFVGVLPSPIQIGVGGVALATGLGLILRLRLAHSTAMLLSGSTLGVGGYRLWRALESASRLELVKAGVMVAVGLYLLVSLLAVRKSFRPAEKPAK